MASNHQQHEKMPSLSSTISSRDNSSPESTSSDGTNSTPNTPPTPEAVLQPQSMIVEPQIIAPKNGQTPQKRSPKRFTPPKNRLGAIYEDTDIISPDIPVRSPRRLLGGMQHNKLFQLAFPPSQPRPPPPKIYDDIEGPKGEKFVDVRNNTRNGEQNRSPWKRFVCLGLMLVIITAIVAIILIAVLLTRKNRAHSAQQAAGSNATNSASNQGFPTGNYAIAQYLDNVDTSCTSNAATWSCYPYQTYNQSATASLSTLNWVISANTTASNSSNVGYLISSTDTLFSYTFQSRPLTLENNNTDNEAYTFTYPFVKTVYPNVALTSDGSKTRCFFNNTLLTARLFTKKAKEASLMNETTTAKNQPWPYALEFFETISTGNDVPNCYTYTNGVIGEAVGVATSSQANGVCRCDYQNYGL